ncbi:MAG: MFS transporter [Devosiaceae bacterium]|nr:MFS transporter [Devosiaceae bacterium MH13]
MRTLTLSSSPFLQHRVSVSAMFLLNGMLVGGWAPAIPFFKDKHTLVESELGLMLLLIGIGSLVTMPITGAIIARYGSAGILRIATAACVPALALVLWAPSLAFAIPALLFFGAALGSMDVSMNANASRVEQVHSKATMSSCHGFWSLGALIGSGLGGLVIGTFGLVAQGLMVGATIALVAAVLGGRTMRDGVDDGAESTGDAPKPKLTLPRSLPLYLVALTALAAFTAEGSVLDWGALYLRNEQGVPEWMAGYGFAAFAGMMALVRFAGDGIRTRFGDQRTFMVSSLLSTVGFLIAGLSPTLAISVVGFALAGLGLANLVPIGFAAADRIPGIPRGIGISIATFCGYSGLLIAPPLIGFAAEVTSFATIFACVALMPAYCLLVSRFVTPRADAER